MKTIRFERTSVLRRSPASAEEWRVAIACDDRHVMRASFRAVRDDEKEKRWT